MGILESASAAAEEDGSARASQARLLCAFVLGTRLGWGTRREYSLVPLALGYQSLPVGLCWKLLGIGDQA